MVHALRRITALATLSVLLVACGESVVETDELEGQVADALEAQVGQRPEVDCPDTLDPEVGATVRCTITAEDGTALGATVTVTEVEGDTVNFDIQVDG